MAPQADSIAGLAKILAWPLIALVAIFIFAGPIKEQLQSGNISTIKLGAIELNMRDQDSNLPQLTSREVAKGLVGLSEGQVVALLDTKPESPYQQCMGDQPPTDFDREYVNPFKDLAKRGLANVTQTGEKAEKCLELSLTEQGKAARKFITDLIAAQLKTAKTQ
jgi:hypothetical protein